MKNQLLFSFFLLWTSLLPGQVLDSLKVAGEVDSLLGVSRSVLGKDAANANTLCEKAIELSLKTFGKESEPYAKSVNLHGVISLNKGDFDIAEKDFKDAIEIRVKVLGKTNPLYAQSINNLARLYHERGKFSLAEPLYLEAKNSREASLGRKHPDYANSLMMLGKYYLDLGKYDAAEKHFNEASETFYSIYGKNNNDYAASKTFLGYFYVTTGNYEKSESNYLESLSIYNQLFSKESIEYAKCQNNLASLYIAKSEYHQAEPLLLESKKTLAKILGTTSPVYANALNNLAVVYYEMALYNEAEQINLEVLKIREEKLGKEHPAYALTLNNLAGIYAELGQIGKSIEYHKSALAVREKVLGKDHLDYAQSLNNLAKSFLHEGILADVDSLFSVALSVRENILGRESRLCGNTISNIGSYYYKLKDYDKAIEKYKEANYIYKKDLGIHNIVYIGSLYALLYTYRKNHKTEGVIPLFLEDVSLRREFVWRSAGHLSQSELINLYLTHEISNALLYSYGIDFRNLGIAFYRALWNNALAYKGAALETHLQLSNALAGAASDSLVDLQLRWKGYQRRIASKLAEPLSKQGELPELEAQANTLEKELRRALPGFDRALQQVGWEDVRNNLQPNEVAIEFVRFRYSNPEPTDSVVYAALVLRPKDEAPQFVYLCTEQQLKTVLSRWDKDNLEASPDKIYRQKSGEPSLYALLWQPLEPLLPQHATIWYAPDGLLHRLNLGALSLAGKQVLANAFFLRRVGSTRQLVLNALSSPKGNEAALFGGLNYKSDTLAIEKTLMEQGITIPRTRDLEGRLPALPKDSTAGCAGSISYLKNAGSEVQDIAKKLGASGLNPHVYTKFSGTEEAFLNIGGNYSAQEKKQSPRILHIATHGYFFPDPKEEAVRQQNPDGTDRHIPYRISDDPFIRSGLLLSGSEQAWCTGKPASEKLADGILTAADIATMDLSNTELAVLSACETGLGDVESNEGVFGLQRAFKIAGTHYLIMSLWKVDDQATMKLMTLFYDKWLAQKSIPVAFKEAQEELRSMKDLSNPYFWAGFVLVE